MEVRFQCLQFKSAKSKMVVMNTRFELRITFEEYSSRTFIKRQKEQVNFKVKEISLYHAISPLLPFFDALSLIKFREK